MLFRFVRGRRDVCVGVVSFFVGVQKSEYLVHSGRFEGVFVLC